MDLVASLRSHPLMSGIEVLDRRANEAGTPRFAGVLNHHTVSNRNSGRYPSLGICQHGRRGSHPVPGPLCNILGARGGGSIAVISNRVANHAGRGDPDVLRRARAGQPAGGRPGPDQANAGGGPGFIGIEWENDGTGEPWAPLMLDTMWRTNAALCALHGWDPLAAVVQHAEWTRRKIDCAFLTPPITYDQFRRDVARVLTDHDQEDEMTPAQEQKLDDLAKQVRDLRALVDALAVGPGWGHKDGALPLLQRIARKLGA